MPSTDLSFFDTYEIRGDDLCTREQTKSQHCSKNPYTTHLSPYSLAVKKGKSASCSTRYYFQIIKFYANVFPIDSLFKPRLVLALNRALCTLPQYCQA